MLDVDLAPCGGSLKDWTTSRCSSPSAGASLRLPVVGQRRGPARLPSPAVARRGGAEFAEPDAGAQDRLRWHRGGTGQPRCGQVPAAAGAQQRLHPGTDFSPIVVMGQDFLDELRPLARRCITRNHYHHYRGFYATQRKLIAKEEPKRAKPVLYAYRVLMTGIHLLRTGEVEANLLRLNVHFRFGFLDELIAEG